MLHVMLLPARRVQVDSHCACSDHSSCTSCDCGHWLLFSLIGVSQALQHVLWAVGTFSWLEQPALNSQTVTTCQQHVYIHVSDMRQIV